MSIQTELAQYMSDQGIGVYSPDDTNGTIFVDQLPETSGSFSVSGEESGFEDDIKLGYIKKSVAVIYRGGTDPIAAYDIMKPLYDLLKGFEGLLIASGKWVVGIIPSGDPKPAGQDSKRNYIYRLRFTIEFKDS